jgi:hypothetical protein
MQSSPEESDIPGVVGRRSARLSIIVPITVRGTDASGHAFKENTWTITVNKQGGRIATFHQLADGEEIVIENPLLGRNAKARVVRVCEKRFAADPFEVCVELLEAQNVWGVKLPPEDWQQEPQAGAGGPASSGPQAAPQIAETGVATAEKGGEAGAARQAPAGTRVEMGEHNAGLSQFNMAVNALSRFAGEAQAPPAQTVPPRPEVGGVPKPAGGRLQTADVITFKSLQEKVGEAQALQKDLSALVDTLQSARAEMESFLLKGHEMRRNWTLEAEQVAKENLSKATLEFQDQCKHAVEQAGAEIDGMVKRATSDAEARLSKDVEGSPLLSAQIERSAEQAAHRQLEEFQAQIERVRKSGEDFIQQSLEKMRQEVQAETLSVGIQARKFYKDESATAAKAISVCVDSAVDALNHASDEAAVKLQAARQTLEASLEKTVEECLPRLAGESASVLEKFRAEAQARATQLQSQMESSAREFSEKARREISDKLEGAVEGALELVARDFNKQAEDSLELLKEGIRSAQARCLEDMQKQLSAARQVTLTALECEVGAKSASFREQLHTTLREMLEQQTSEIEAGIQTSLQNLLQSLGERIQASAEESAARVTTEVRNRAEEAMQGLADRLYKGVGTAALLAKEWEEQSKTHLEAHARQLLEVFPKELEALTAAAQQRQRNELEAVQSLFRDRLKQAARLFEHLETEASPPEEAPRAQAPPEESANPPLQSFPPPATLSPPDLEPLLEKQQRIIEEALAAFRSRLSQILAGQTPGE